MNIEYGIKTEDCQYGRRGVYAETDVVTIASIPGTISCILRYLSSAGIDDDEFRDVRREIENQELFGHELVSQLRVLLQRHGHKLHGSSDQLTTLSEIECLVAEQDDQMLR